MGFEMVEMRFHGFHFHPMANGKVQNKSFLESPSFDILRFPMLNYAGFFPHTPRKVAQLVASWIVSWWASLGSWQLGNGSNKKGDTF
jgi:hypothetical protein